MKQMKVYYKGQWDLEKYGNTGIERSGKVYFDADSPCSSALFPVATDEELGCTSGLGKSTKLNP
jgi:hypothetical protein